MAIYKVVSPDGVEHEIEGPDGATDEEVIQQAQILFHQQSAPAAEKAQPPEAMPNADGFSAMEALGNVPGSAKRLGENLFEAVSHPIDTVSNLAKTVGSLGALGLNRAGARFSDADTARGKAVVDFYKGRYGGTDNALETLEKDPVGLAADLAGALTGGGMAFRGAGLAKAGSLAGAAGNLVDPVVLAAKAAQAAGKGAMNIPGINKLPLNIYQGTAKFKDVAVAEQALNRGIRPAKDVEKVKTDNKKIGEDIGAMVAGNTSIISPNILIRGFAAHRDRVITKPGIEGRKQRKAFNKEIVAAADEFNLMRRSTSGVTPEMLQAFKKDLYKRNYPKGKTPQTYASAAKQGREQARIFLAQRADQMLDRIIGPQYGVANKEYGTLKDIGREIKPMPNQMANANSMSRGLGRAATLGALGSVAGGAPWGLAAAGLSMAANIAIRPNSKIGIAIGLNKLQRQGLLKGITKPNGNILLRDALIYIGQYGNEEDKQKLEAMAPSLAQ